jgi:hypothetical protein
MSSLILTKQVKGIKDKCIAPDGCVAIPVLSWHAKDSEYFTLSPYYLKTDGLEENVNSGGVIFENFWQGVKVYPSVTDIEHYKHYTLKGNPNALVWSYKTSPGVKFEKHYDATTDTILPDYFKWRASLWSSRNAVRYPVGYYQRHTVKFAVISREDGSQSRYDYIESRINIYAKEYKRLVRALPEYKKILDILKSGQKICIFEIDVPAVGKPGEFGKNIRPDGTYELTRENLDVLLNDKSAPYGHGLCLADALFEDLAV